MKKLLEKNQGWGAIAFSIALFWMMPRIIMYFDPTDAGISKEFVLAPGGYLHQLLMGVVIFFLGIGMAWQTVQLDWKAFDRRIDRHKVDGDLQCISDAERRLRVLFTPYFLHLLWFVAAQLLAMKMLK